MKNIIKIFKTRKALINELKLKNDSIDHLKKRLELYEQREEDIRQLKNEKEELNNLVIELNLKMMKLQEDKILDLQNQREFEEANERLEQLVEVYKDIIKGSKTIGSARKEADKLKEVE